MDFDPCPHSLSEFIGAVRLDAEASGKKEYFDSLSVGISQIVDPTMERPIRRNSRN